MKMMMEILIKQIFRVGNVYFWLVPFSLKGVVGGLLIPIDRSHPE
jgi:hypothetical protein